MCILIGIYTRGANKKKKKRGENRTDRQTDKTDKHEINGKRRRRQGGGNKVKYKRLTPYPPPPHPLSPLPKGFPRAVEWGRREGGEVGGVS